MGTLLKPNVLIVIVSYNRADVTNLMMRSLYEVKGNTPFEVIVIDNQSKKEEHDQMKAEFDRLMASGGLGKFISNPTNAGYSAGNNIGIKYGFENADRFSHLCLLNNDTIVSDYWLDRLVEHNLDGLIGPVSNSVGNEQRVPAFYETTGDLEVVKKSAYAYAQDWYRTHKGSVATTWMLGFFCVFGKIEVFQKIGLLDEKFGIGTYEDDDYCCRARALNIPLTIARDVFIHHWGSASFSKLNQRFFHDLMERNRKYYESKNGAPWKHPATTTFEAYRNELTWFQTHPDPMIQKCLDNYELTLKWQLSYSNESYLRLRSKPLWESMDAWISTNTLSTKIRKTATLIFAALLSLADSEKPLKGKMQHWKKRWKEVMSEN